MSSACHTVRAFAIASVALLSLWGSPAGAAELVMFERAGCGWCARWNREIGPIYPRTAEARLAPLRRVDLTSGMPADLRFIAPVRFTPTFVLVDNGREVGRLVGYISEDAFWGLLGGLLKSVEHENRAEMRTKAK